MNLLHRHHDAAPSGSVVLKTVVLDEQHGGLWEVPTVELGSDPDAGFRSFLIEFADWVREQHESAHGLFLVIMEARPKGKGEFDMDRQVAAIAVPADQNGSVDAQALGGLCHQVQQSVIAMERAGKALGWFTSRVQDGANVKIGIVHREFPLSSDESKVGMREEFSEVREFPLDDDHEIEALEYQAEIEAKVQSLRDTQEQTDLGTLESVVERQVNAEDEALAQASGDRTLDLLRSEADGNLTDGDVPRRGAS